MHLCILQSMCIGLTVVSRSYSSGTVNIANLVSLSGLTYQSVTDLGLHLPAPPDHRHQEPGHHNPLDRQWSVQQTLFVSAERKLSSCL